MDTGVPPNQWAHRLADGVCQGVRLGGTGDESVVGTCRSCDRNEVLGRHCVRSQMGEDIFGDRRSQFDCHGDVIALFDPAGADGEFGSFAVLRLAAPHVLALGHGHIDIGDHPHRGADGECRGEGAYSR